MHEVLFSVKYPNDYSKQNFLSASLPLDFTTVKMICFVETSLNSVNLMFSSDHKLMQRVNFSLTSETTTFETTIKRHQV